MIRPVIYRYYVWVMNWDGEEPDDTLGYWDLRLGEIAVNGDRDVPDWARYPVLGEEDAYKVGQLRLF